MVDLILYDGVCGLCNRSIQFVLRRDRADRFRFAWLQSARARDLLHEYGRDPKDLDTVHVVADYRGPGERVLARSRAVIHVLRSLGGVWRLARALEILPVAWLDAVYRFVARRRYRWFGRYDSCALPPARHWDKFLDDAGAEAPKPTT